MKTEEPDDHGRGESGRTGQRRRALVRGAVLSGTGGAFRRRFSIRSGAIPLPTRTWFPRGVTLLWPTGWPSCRMWRAQAQRIQPRVRSSECGTASSARRRGVARKIPIRLRPLPGKRDFTVLHLENESGPSPRPRHCIERKDISRSTPSTRNLTPIIGSRNTCSPIPADDRETPLGMESANMMKPSRPLYSARLRAAG